MVLLYEKLIAVCSSEKGLQVESVAVDAREVYLGCWLCALWCCRLTTKRTRKNSSREGEGINALCLAIGRCIAESLGGGIDSRKGIDLWLLQKIDHHHLLSR